MMFECLFLSLEVFVSDKRISVELEEESSSLLIKGVEEEDTATYYCHSTTHHSLKLPFIVQVQGQCQCATQHYPA
jgi:hypothetical protein